MVAGQHCLSHLLGHVLRMFVGSELHYLPNHQIQSKGSSIYEPLKCLVLPNWQVPMDMQICPGSHGSGPLWHLPQSSVCPPCSALRVSGFRATGISEQLLCPGPEDTKIQIWGSEDHLSCNGKQSEKKNTYVCMYVYIYMNRFAEHMKLTL